MNKSRGVLMGIIGAAFVVIFACEGAVQVKSSQRPAGTGDTLLDMVKIDGQPARPIDSTTVRYLFERDGCRVYAFEDLNATHYLATRTASFTHERTEPCSVSK